MFAKFNAFRFGKVQARKNNIDLSEEIEVPSSLSPKVVREEDSTYTSDQFDFPISYRLSFSREKYQNPSSSFSQSSMSKGEDANSDFSVGNSSPTTSSAYSVFDNSEFMILGSQLSKYEDAEERFLDEHEGYFVHLYVDNVRRDQYPKLDNQRITYLDYATCPLFSRSQVEQHMQFLLGDSHPILESSYTINKHNTLQNSYADDICERILSLLGTSKDKYSMIFTTDLSSCYRLFGKAFNFPKGSLILTTQDHHNFIQNMVSDGDRSNVKIMNIPLKTSELCIHGTEFHKLIRKRGWSSHGCGFLAYPSQSFFSGMCHSLNWIAGAQQNGWKVLLDVSSCLPMTSVDLSLYQPEFVVGSLYHMLGYPSALSFLLVRRSSHSISNGSMPSELSICEMVQKERSIHIDTEREGLNFHTFAAFSFGLKHLEDIGVLAIQRRIQSLISWLLNALKSLRHKVGDNYLVQFYGSLDPKHRGSILVFNVLDCTGSVLPAGLVQRRALECNIFLGSTVLDVHNAYQGANSLALSPCLVVRLSLGPVSTFSDVFRLVQFLSRFREESFVSASDSTAEYIVV